MKNKEKNQQNDHLSVPKSRKNNIFAFILCVLISMAIWVYVANRDMIRSNEPQPPNSADASAQENTNS